MDRRRLRRWLLGAAGAVTVGVAVTTVVTTSGCQSFGANPSGARLERVKGSPHWANGEFQNEEPTTVMSEEAGSTWDSTVEFIVGNDQMRVPNCALPLYSGAAEKLRAAPESGLRITWLGHSTTLIEIDGQVLLTDPMWSDRASPSTLVGPHRFHPPPLPLESLPRVDAVLVSHDHYDHLDMETVRALSQRGVEFHVALGVGEHLEKWGIPPAQIVEHDWWEQKAIRGTAAVQVVSTPSRHFSGRGLLNRNGTLWSSWAIVGPKHRVYFSGDTGFTGAFKTIAERLGPFDVSLLEIGQWHPSWGQIHLGPEGALQAHKDLGARWLFPIHWATFELGLHAWSEPPETLTQLASRDGVRLVTPMLGEPAEPERTQTSAWWRAYPPIAERCPRGAEVTRRSLDDWPM